jgi:DeoR family transcriptional regulator of aga operon
MLGAERRKLVLRLVREEGVAQVAELARRLDASASTIRRDLTDLQNEGLLQRTHGGALAPEAPGEPDRRVPQRAHAAEKHRIARAAAAYIEPGSTVLITGGTTTQALAPFLPWSPTRSPSPGRSAAIRAWRSSCSAGICGTARCRCSDI